MNSKLGFMNIEDLYSQNNINIKPKQLTKCQKNQHTLKIVGESCNGRKDGNYANVYKCLKCDTMGYKEDFN